MGLPGLLLSQEASAGAAAVKVQTSCVSASPVASQVAQACTHHADAVSEADTAEQPRALDQHLVCRVLRASVMALTHTVSSTARPCFNEFCSIAAQIV